MSVNKPEGLALLDSLGAVGLFCYWGGLSAPAFTQLFLLFHGRNYEDNPGCLRNPETMNEAQLRARNTANRKLAAKPGYTLVEITDLDPLMVSTGGETDVPAVASLTDTFTVGDLVDAIKVGNSPYRIIGKTTTTPGKWETLALEANWSGAIQYRMVGDTIEVRGSAVRDTGVTNLVGTLPAGFAPPFNS